MSEKGQTGSEEGSQSEKGSRMSTSSRTKATGGDKKSSRGEKERKGEGESSTAVPASVEEAQWKEDHVQYYLTALSDRQAEKDRELRQELDDRAKCLQEELDHQEELRQQRDIDREDKLRKEFDDRERVREAQFNSLLNRLAEATEASTRLLRENEAQRRQDVKEQEEAAKQRWEKEKKAREKQTAIKAIPAPQPMQRDQDVADYIDLFMANMESREISPVAQAKHLLPLLNVKAATAIAGLTPEAKDDIKTVVKTLMDTAQVAPAYVSQQVWNYEKETSEGVRASVIKLVRLTKRLGQNEGEILDRLMAEKVMQMFHPEVQQYVREKEPKDPDEAAEWVVRYFKLKNIEEHKYAKSKPWTHKSKEEKPLLIWGQKPHSRWSSQNNGWKRHFKERSNDSHQGYDNTQLQERSQDSADGADGSANPKMGSAEESKGTQSSNSLVSQQNKQNSNGNGYGAGETRRCHYCGKVGHLMKDCRKRKHVAAAHVPSLAAIAGDALVVPGKIGDQQVEAMLCDSGATICVIADHLIPKGTDRLENMWVGTVDVEPRSYPTVIVPAEVQGKRMELFAAVMPAERLPYPVILGRFIPGKKVAWSMKVTDEHGTVLQLTQETEARPTTPTTTVKTPAVNQDDECRTTKDMSCSQTTYSLNTGTQSEQEGAKQQQQALTINKGEEIKQTKIIRRRRKNKFKAHQEVIEKSQEAIMMEKTETDGPKVLVGEASSQVLEGNTTDALLSLSGKEIWPGKQQTVVKEVRIQEGPPEEIVLTTVPGCAVQQEMQDSVSAENRRDLAAVETRSQKKKRQEKEERDEEATLASGVVLSTPQYQTKRLKQQTGGTPSIGDTPTAGEDNIRDAQTCSNEEEKKPNWTKGVTTDDKFNFDLEASKDKHGSDPPPPEKSIFETTHREDCDAAGVLNVHGISQAVEKQENIQPTGVSTPEEPVMDITREEFLEAQKQDPAMQHMWKQATIQSQEPKRKQEWKIENGILLRQWRQFSSEEEDDSAKGDQHTTVVVPTKYRIQVLKRGHDYAGHQGVKKTKKLVEDHFFWPGMARRRSQ